MKGNSIGKLACRTLGVPVEQNNEIGSEKNSGRIKIQY